MTPLTRKIATIVATLGIVASLAACAPEDSATKAYLNGQNSGYIAGDGTVVEIPEAERKAPIDFAGEDENGKQIDGTALRGDVVVVNFWYAGCAPCRIEAADLETVYQTNKDSGVHFVGVNTSDLADTALAFMKDYEVTYPSIIDVKSGSAKLAFAQATPIQATPTTLVLDKQGRVAARIIGPIDGTSILNTLVTELQAATS